MNRYEKNAFRILGLSVTASGREVIRREQEIVRYLEMGRDPSGRDELPAFAPQQRTVQEVRDAAQRLGAPLRRIREELFWFHLDDEVGKQARQWLSPHSWEAAAHVFANALAADDANVTTPATHNLAVLYHLTVLAREATPELRQQEPLLDNQHWEVWQKALGYWCMVWRSSRFWDGTVRRARELENLQRMTDETKRLWDDLPSEILNINADLAMRYLDEDRLDSAARHVALIRNAGFPREAIEEADRKVLEGFRRRVQQACDKADEIRHLSDDDLTRSVAQLQEIAYPLLELVRDFYPDDTYCADKVADLLRSLAIDLNNKAKDHYEAERLLSDAFNFASAGSVLKQQISSDLNTARDNIAQHLRSESITYANDRQDYEMASGLIREAQLYAQSDELQKQLAEDWNTVERLRLVDAGIKAMEKGEYQMAIQCFQEALDYADEEQAQNIEEMLLEAQARANLSMPTQPTEVQSPSVGDSPQVVNFVVRRVLQKSLNLIGVAAGVLAIVWWIGISNLKALVHKRFDKKGITV